MQDRAAVVLQLREVVLLLDEVSLGACLATYNTLREVHGDFCEPERQRASDLHGRLVEELRVISSAATFVRESQTSLCQRLDSVEQYVGEGSDLTQALKSSMEPILDCIEPLLRAEYVFATAPAANIIKLFEVVLEVRIQWALSEWKVVADTVVLLLDLATHLWPADCTCASLGLQQCAATVSDLISKEISMVSGGIDVNVILPMLCRGVADGRAVQSAEEGDLVVDAEPLASAITAVSQIVTIGPQSKTFLKFVESVLVFRTSISQDDFEVVLALTEPVQVTARRYTRSAEMLKCLHQTSCSQYMDDCKAKDEVSYALFPRRDMCSVADESRLHASMMRERSRGLPLPLYEVIESVVQELRGGRQFALNRYSQV
jgi:hypothetical protein